MTSEPPKKSRRARLFVILAIMVALYGVAHYLGFAEQLKPEHLRGVVAEAGAWGPLLFGAIIIGGVLAQIPSMVFLTTAPFIFPLAISLPVCLIAGNIVVNLNFFLVRSVGGQSLTELKRPWAQRIFQQLEDKPLRSVFLLRATLIMFSPLTGALALTSLSTREHAIATAIGLLPPVVGVLVIESLLFV